MLLYQPQLQKEGVRMSLWEGMLVSFVPVVCEFVILQELYTVLFGEKVSIDRRIICILFFFIVQYPVVFLTDYFEFLEPIKVVRSAFAFTIFALFLKATFKSRFMSRCLPAAAVFTFISIVIEAFLWYFVGKIGLKPFDVRYSIWKVLIFQAVLYCMEFGAVRAIRKLNIPVGYSEKEIKRMWLPTVGYLVVIVVFWVALAQQLGPNIKSGYFGALDVVSIIVCLFVSLMFIKSSMDISRENELRQRELYEQKKELEYQKLYNSGMEAMLFEVARFRHNYANTLAVLRGYSDSGDFEHLKEYIDKLCQTQNIALAVNREALAQIKNGAVAGLLASKMLMAEKSKISFKLTINGELTKVNMQLMELCEVLGILLDNAVEAAAASEGKYVRVVIDTAESGAFFHIENTIDKKPNISQLFEKGYTTKKDGSGIGLYIAETLLQKYPFSSLNTFADDERFIQELNVI